MLIVIMTTVPERPVASKLVRVDEPCCCCYCSANVEVGNKWNDRAPAKVQD